MKKILLVLALSGVAAVAFGQGQVQFRTYYANTVPAVNARVYLDSVGGTLVNSANTAWRAALIGGPTTGTAAVVPGSYTGAGSVANVGTLSLLADPNNAAITWVNFRSGTSAPFADGYINNSGSTTRATSVAWGGQALVQLVAWEGNYTTWADAFNAWNSGVQGVRIGASNPLTLQLPNSVTDQNLTYLWGLQSFAIVPVPEPTAFALAGLGAAALLIFRRRN